MTATVQCHGCDDEIQAMYRGKLEESRLLLRELSKRLNAGELGLRAAVDEATDRCAHWFKLARAFGADVGDNAMGWEASQ
jgi:hypothetical protein